MSDFDLKNLEAKIEKSLNVLKEEMGTVRAGRANAALVDKVMVEYYGTHLHRSRLSLTYRFLNLEHC